MTSLLAARNRNARRARLIERVRRIYALGDRVVFELVDEIARRSGRRKLVEQIAENFASIDPAALRVTGGDRFPAPPLRIVGWRP
jgi:hypothetical protein